MVVSLPIDMLRSLIAFADVGTLRQAAERVHRSASALSLQMDRLERLSGLVLFERRGRTLALTAAGELLVSHAREILDRHDAAVAVLQGAAKAGEARLGLVQDFAEPLLVGILSRLRAMQPLAQVGIQVGPSAELRAALLSGALDVALAVCDGRQKPIRVDRPVWLGDARLIWQNRLPLVLLAPPCPFSDAARAALESMGRSYHVALQTPSLLGMRAAIEAGLGIGCRTRLFAAGRLPVLDDPNLPDLAEIAYAVLRARRLGPAGASLAAIVEEAVAELPA